MATVSFNFRTIEAMGVRARPSLSGWFDGPSTSREVKGVSGRAGVILSPLETSDARLMTVTLYCPLTSLADRLAAKETIDLATAGIFWFGTSDRANVYTRCVRQGAIRVTGVSERAVLFAAPMILTLTLLALDGVSVESHCRIESVSSTGTACTIGTGTSAPLFTMKGAWSSGASRTLTYKNAAGIVLGSLTLTAPTGASLASGDQLEVDCGEETITKVTSSGVRSDAADWLDTGDFFVLDPSDRLTNASPLVAVSAGTCDVVYLNTWNV